MNDIEHKIIQYGIACMTYGELFVSRGKSHEDTKKCLKFVDSTLADLTEAVKKACITEKTDL